MDEKLQLARGHDPIPRPVSTSTLDDSDFESHDDDESEMHTPRSSHFGNNHPDLPPSYDESQAAALEAQPQLPGHYPPGVENHSEITVYRTEIPPDPVIHIQAPANNTQPSRNRDEKRPISPPSPVPRASALLNEALRFTETPPPSTSNSTLRAPVAVPSLPQTSGPVKFARFFAEVLGSQSITASEFVDFIDGMNALSTASYFSASTFRSRNEISSYEVSRDDNNIPREDLISAYIALCNTHFFNPRGLRIQIADLSQLADLVKLTNPAIRKAILEEVLRVSRAGVDVPTAANGAANAATEALVPYVEPLSAAVPEPRKHNEALESLASRLASMELADEPTPMNRAQPQERRSHDERPPSFRSQNSADSYGAGPSRSKSWADWGEEFGKKCGDWGEKQGRMWGDWGMKKGEFWEKWGEEQGRKWGQWGENIGRKAEKLASGPPWARDENEAHARDSGSGPWGRGGRTMSSGPWGRGGGPFGHNGGPFGHHGGPFGHHGGPFGQHGGPFGGRGGPFGGRGGPFGPHRGPFGPHGPFGGRGFPMPPTPGVEPFDNTAEHSTPPAQPGQEFHPGSFSGLYGVHQPPPPPPTGGPFGVRGEVPENHDDDRSDTLSISSSSSSSSSDSDRTYVHEDAEAIFAQKVAEIERMAENARARGCKPEREITIERERALVNAEKEKTKHQLHLEKRAMKKALKADKQAWKAGKKEEYYAWKREAKGDRHKWKREKKGEWRKFKADLRALKHAEKEALRRAKRESKAKAWAEKREGKRKEWADKRSEWAARKGRNDSRRSLGSMESAGSAGNANVGGVEEVEEKAREMLWIVVTKVE